MYVAILSTYIRYARYGLYMWYEWYFGIAQTSSSFKCLDT